MYKSKCLIAAAIVGAWLVGQHHAHSATYTAPSYEHFDDRPYIYVPPQLDLAYRQVLREIITTCGVYHYPFCNKFVPAQEAYLAKNAVYVRSTPDDGLNELIDFCINNPNLNMCRRWDVYIDAMDAYLKTDMAQPHYPIGANK